MKLSKSVVFALAFALMASMGLTACSPEVGSKEWCEDMKKKDKGNWTANEVKEFAKNCVL